MERFICKREKSGDRMINESITLNTSNKNIKSVINVSQGENGARSYQIRLVDNAGVPLDFTDKEVVFYVNKNDGNVVMLPTTVSEDVATVTLTQQACTAYGDNDCWIQVIDGAKQEELRVDNLVLRVKQCNFDGAITSTSEFALLTQKITEVNEAINSANDAAESANTMAETTTINTINTLKGQPNGIASLDENGKLVQMPTVNDIGISAIFLAVHPVGSIYMSVNSTNPGTLFGGTWVAWGSGRVPVCVDTTDDDFKTAEKKGGAKTHTLTKNEIPSHVHHIQKTAMFGEGNTGWNFISTSNGDWKGYHKDTDATGGGQAHNNLQPYITCYMWKRTA